MKRYWRQMGRESRDQALTEDVACRGSVTVTLRGVQPRSFCILSTTAAMPAPQSWAARRPPAGAHLMANDAVIAGALEPLSGAGWRGPAAGPGSHWGKETASGQ